MQTLQVVLRVRWLCWEKTVGAEKTFRAKNWLVNRMVRDHCSAGSQPRM